jgi:predicted nuclease with TOPRIM domain
MDESLKVSFSRIKEEMDIHLDSINENTNEINSNFEHVARLEDKIDKLNERIDELHMMFSSLIGDKPEVKEVEFEKIKLSTREQEVFLALYTSQNELTYYDISRKLGLTPDLVEKYIKMMLEKGVPIIRKLTENKVFLMVDDEFKNLQTKENVLKIHENISSVFEQ